MIMVKWFGGIDCDVVVGLADIRKNRRQSVLQDAGDVRVIDLKKGLIEPGGRCPYNITSIVESTNTFLDFW